MKLKRTSRPVRPSPPSGIDARQLAALKAFGDAGERLGAWHAKDPNGRLQRVSEATAAAMRERNSGIEALIGALERATRELLAPMQEDRHGDR